MANHPPPEYLMPPVYKSSSSSSTVDSLYETMTSCGSNLPSYDSPASLEPWLSSLRRPEWTKTASLALFLPPEDRRECWCDSHERILRGVIEHGLPLEQDDGAESDWMLWDLPEATCSFVRETLPPELRRTGFSFALGTGSRRKLVLNPLLISAIDRLEIASGPSHFHLSHASRLILTILPSALSRKLSVAALPTADLELLLTALFIILCRFAWISSVEARIQSAEAHEHLLQALPSILRKMVPHKNRWKAGTRTPTTMSPPSTPKQNANPSHNLVSVHA